MNTYNPVKQLAAWQRLQEYCWDMFGANAPEAVATMCAAFIIGGGLGLVALAI